MIIEQAAHAALNWLIELDPIDEGGQGIIADLKSALASQPTEQIQHIEWDTCKIHGSFIAGHDGVITRAECPQC